ncbi:hypothetical protein GBAR_LOCUS521 [Geodia barretti]|uniref:Fibronectin type-III domain-containing protein n=1 Tax=Geodia barretti TaxID=519541 RepID=A0AA35QSU0_GEOBA|nr:hypothetical protein GBAR_LOCUS521 [Geodia barretti]
MCFSGDYTDLFLTLSDDEIHTKHILITDVSQSSGDTLICWSTRAHRTFSWFHQFRGSEELTELPRVTENKPSYFGWKIEIGREFGYNKLTLLKEMDTIPIEGVFTCCVGSDHDLDSVDNSEAVSVGIHYSILSVTGSIQSLEGGNGKFRVICTSTGGSPLIMSVTGPSGVVENMKNIVGKGSVEWVGNDTFSAEVIRTNGTHGDVYGCMASNGVSNASHSFSLKVAGSPTLILVVQASVTSVIVEWSQPPGGATVTGYLVHYSHGDSNTTKSNMTDSTASKSVPGSSTHALITNLTEML